MLLYIFFYSLLSTCPKKIETEKLPTAADSPLHSIPLHIDHFVSQPFAIFLVTWSFHVRRSSSPYWWKTKESDFWCLQLNGSLYRLKNFEESGSDGNPMVPNQVGPVRHAIQAAKISVEWPNLCVVVHCRGKIQHLSYSPTLVAFAWWQHPIYPTDDSTRLYWWFGCLVAAQKIQFPSNPTVQRASPSFHEYLLLQLIDRIHLAWTTSVFA